VVLSPTRELAIQIFQVLKVAGKHHAFSVCLLIGGKKDFYQEQQQIGSTNIVIATPGRLLQHLEQTPYFDLSELKILVLDEADRILDLGFRDQLVRILDYLPSEQRQTLLFSATQTRDVSALATLSLRQPEYLGVHDKEKTSTPESLNQSYVVVPLEHKLNAVYSFIKSHLKCKSIIFMATCAQIRYAKELFCSIRPGVTVTALHGKLSQVKRTQIYFDFLQ
jgi:ATP-dependent RNA helicase DDX10/DBP4